MIDESTHWQSTKALSVYNVLVAKQTNALPLTHVLAVLQSDHIPRYGADDVMRGVEFLQARGFIRQEDGVIVVTHSAGPHRPVRLKRANDDSDLELDP